MQKRNEQILWALFAAFAIGFAGAFYLKHVKELAFIQDDAYTVFRYVKNFLSGNGLVFNPGERVQGYTDFLWVLFLIVGGRYFNLPALAQTLSITFGSVFLLALPYFAFLVLKEEKGKPADLLLILLPSFVFAFNADFVYWSVSGMETPLYLLLFTATVVAKANNSRLFTPLAVLTSLTRPEGILLFFVLEFGELLFRQKEQGKQDYFKIAFETFFYSVLVLSYLLFSYFYYGNFLPNTFYAKTGFDWFHLKRGVKYFTDYFSQAYAIVFLAVPVVYYLIKKKKNYTQTLLLTVTLVFIFYNVLIGGDVLPMGRFFLPPSALGVLLFVLMLKELAFLFFNKSSVLYTSVIVAVVVLVSFVVIESYDARQAEAQNWRGFERGLVFKMKEYARWIKKRQKETKRKFTVALSTIGAFSYYSDAIVVDMIGLTDSYIAHHPKELQGIDERISVLWRERHYNAEYVLSRKPDFILFPAGVKPSAYPEAAVFSLPGFANNYYVELIPSEKANQYLPVFRKIPDNLRKLHFPKVKNNCSVKATEFYILGNNNFLAFLKYGKKKYFQKVFVFADSLKNSCPAKKYLSLNLKGMAEFHAGHFTEARKYFEKSLAENQLNTMALPYLINIYRKSGEKGKELRAYLTLKQLCK